jgi:hypothetical protein
MKITRWNSTDPVAQLNERSGFYRKAARRSRNAAAHEIAIYGWTPYAAEWQREADHLRDAAVRLSAAAVKLLND